jgi:hypothetical protein
VTGIVWVTGIAVEYNVKRVIVVENVAAPAAVDLTVSVVVAVGL